MSDAEQVSEILKIKRMGIFNHIHSNARINNIGSKMLILYGQRVDHLYILEFLRIQ